MRYKARSVIAMASLALAIAVPAAVNAQAMGDRERMMELVSELQQLKDEVRMLRGQIEEQAFEIENLKRRQRDQYLDIDQRLNDLASGAPTRGAIDGAGATTLPERGMGASGGRPAEPIPENVEDVPEVREPIDTPSTVAGLGTPSTAGRAAPVSPQAEKQAYDEAFQALKELRYAEAADGFQDFLARYPDSDYADNAQYWLGESYYVTRNYEFALEAFETLRSGYPNSPKLPDSLLKIGYTHYELQQWDQARAALTQVQEQYPDTTLARLAESRLRSMRLEGHY